MDDRRCEPLDLDRERGFGELVATTFELLGRHAGLFLSVTLLLVAPVVILVDGAWGGLLRDAAADEEPAAAIVSGLLMSFVVPPLVTALHATIVRDLGAGRVPSMGEALHDAAPRFLAAIGAVLLYTIGVGLGLVLLIVPGIWLMVRWYFAAQATVLEGLRPGVAIERSAALVKGRWWQTALRLLAAWLLFNVPVFLAMGLAVSLVEAPVLAVSAMTVLQAIAMSFTALFGTLLFFALRARERVAAPPAEPLATA